MRVAIYVAVGILVVLFGPAIFERVAPRRTLRWYWKIFNPPFRCAAGRIPGLGYVLLETTGRRTGRIHHVPVAGRLEGDVVWVVAGHARRSHYVRNIDANPRVRVRIKRRWRRGSARAVREDDARRRAFRLGPINGLFILIATADLVTIRIELEP
jgi:deazaflavin-dependent oxidoreductase (nitroreductase family)